MSLISRKRLQYIVDTRYLSVYFLHKHFKNKYSLRGLSLFVGLDSHASTLHCLKMTENLKKTNIDFKKTFEIIDREFN